MNYRYRKEINLFTDNLGGPLDLNGKIIPWNHSYQSIVESTWQSKKKDPLFKLKSVDKKFTLEFAEKVGLDLDRPLVTLHVRDSNFKLPEPFRDANIVNYEAAINFLISSGYNVIRVGSSTQRSLKPRSHYFELGISAPHNFKLQIGFTALSKFFIGTSSGAYTVANAFGVPVLATNYLPLSNLNLGPNSLFMSKLIRRRNKQYVNFSALFSPPLTMFRIPGQLERLDLEPVENSPGEILEAVTDMHNFLQSELTPNSLQIEFSKKLRQFEILPGLVDYGLACFVAPSFAGRYLDLM